ncbi:MAG: hypothetical protein PWQ37_2754 [Candidatus Petromonas sp.]|jgi:PAS domain S-box-containing protein|nr:hypothetical protein [Candidatus Petromonas sp.]
MFFKKSFRNQLITIFLSAVFIPLIILGALVYNDIYRYLLVRHNENTLESVLNDTSLVNSWFEARVKLLKSIGDAFDYGIINLDDSDAINGYLKEQKNNNGKEFINIYICKINGVTYDANSWAKDHGSVDFRSRPWYIGAYKNDGLYLTEPYKDLVTGKDVITLSIPVKNKKGEFLGVLGVDYYFDKLINEIRSINMGEETFHMILSNKGNTVYNDSEIRDIDYKAFKKQQGRLVEVKHRNKRLIGAYTELSSINFGIITFEEINTYYAQINRFITSFVLISLVAAVLVFFGIVYISNKVTHPVIDLKNGVSRILDGDLDVQLPAANNDDFRELTLSFNLMARNLKDNYENLTKQSKDLFEQNELLQELNTELEASFNQLEATTQQLNYSESKYRNLIKNISDLIWVIDTEGKITYINDSIKDILGYEKEEVLGKHISEIMCPLHHYVDGGNIVEEFNKFDFKDRDLWFLKADGINRVIIDANINRIFSDGKLVSVQGIGRDITEKRMLEETIMRTNKKLSILNEISYFLTDKIKMDELLKTIVNKIHELLRIEICSVRLLKGEKLELKAISGELKEYMKKDPINIHKDLIGKAVKSKEMIVLRDVKETGEYTRESRLYRKIKTLKTLIFIPLILNDRVTGVLTVGSIKKINEDDISILKSLSNYASVALEKARLYENLKESYFKTIKALATAVEAKDAYTEGHSVRVAKYSTLIAYHMGLGEDKIEEINIAGILHDIGKIGINDVILSKPGRLTKEEYSVVTNHPTIGKRILNHIGLSKSILDGVFLHHKRFDLTGYPEDISVDGLPLEARIIGVADAFDAMTTNRSYSSAKNIDEAMEELIWFKGSQFCPEIVDIMEYIYINHRNELEDILNSSETQVIGWEGRQLS